MGRVRLNPDMLLSLIRRCSRLLSLLRHFVESCLHAESSSHGCMTRKNKKMADESQNSGILDTWTLLKRTTALCCNTGQNNDEKKSIHIKNRAWSPSLLLPCHIFYISKIQDGCQKQNKNKKNTRIPKIQKQLQEVKKNI